MQGWVKKKKNCTKDEQVAATGAVFACDEGGKGGGREGERQVDQLQVDNA